MRRTLFTLVLLGFVAPLYCVGAITNTFIPVADTSLLEVNPTNNLGGFAGMNAGTTQEFKKTRALLRFDLTSLPTNAIILSANLKLEVTREPDEPPNITPFGLHRMLRPWGEGDKAPITQPGKGLPATTGEASWECAFHSTNTWTVPGGAADVDYSSVESASQFIYGVGESPYYFETTPELVADVATWVRNSAANFGWMLLCNDELSNFTARRFGSREDPNYPPELEIQYLAPPSITQFEKTGSDFRITFLATPGQNHAVEFRATLQTGSWQTLALIPALTQSTLVLIIDRVAEPQRFYRIRAY